MIWYKTWLESRWRFLFCLALVGTIVAADVVQAHINMPRMGIRPDEFGKYVWKIYFTRFQLTWILSVLFVSMGGLLREQSGGTVEFSLSLPVSRRHWMAVRGAIALIQASILALVPVVVIPIAARTAGYAYPAWEAAKFSALVLLTGLFILALGILYSSIFQGEYTGVALGIATVFALTVMVNPLVGRFTFLSMIITKMLLAAVLWEASNRIIERRSF